MILSLINPKVNLDIYIDTEEEKMIKESFKTYPSSPQVVELVDTPHSGCGAKACWFESSPGDQKFLPILE